MSDDPVTLTRLEALGWDARDVAELCPGAVELVALDGTPCWDRADLVPLLGEVEEHPL